MKKALFVSLCLFFGAFSLGSSNLLGIAEQLIKQNPFQAEQILKSVEPAALSTESLQKYRQLQKELSFFRLPIHKIGLGDENITAVTGDGEDIWLGDRIGSVSRYNLITGEVLNIRRGRPSQTLRGINHILAEENRVWIVAEDAVITYEKKTGDVNTLANPDPQGRPMMLARLNNTLYLAMKNRGLYQWNGETFVPSSVNHENLAPCNVLFVRNNRLWVGTAEGLFWLEGKQWNSVQEFFQKNITAVLPGSDLLWIAVQSEGLYAYHPEEKSVERFLQDSPYITSILMAEKILFAGMYMEGIAEIRQNKSVENRLNLLSPGLLRVGSLSYHDPYLIVGTLGDALFFVHRSLF